MNKKNPPKGLKDLMPLLALSMFADVPLPEKKPKPVPGVVSWRWRKGKCYSIVRVGDQYIMKRRKP